MMPARSTMSIAVAIPCYKVTQHVLGVISAIPASVERIYAVDDACPDGSGTFIEANCTDPRVRVLFNPENRGVGGAVVTAYHQAIADGMDIVVKIDGDGQMDPALLPHFVRPILAGRADYTKGNRFFRPESVRGMPPVRLFGNAVLSFMTKLSCGYWTLMDPTNGYTAVHTSVLRELPLDKLERRYFFETDMLFRLNTLRAVVRDVPMDSVYADEESNLKIGKVLPEFLKKHASRFLRRYGYSYFVRDFNAGSIYSIFGLLLLAWGSIFGARQWIHSAMGDQPATSGTVMLAALPVMVGIQFLVAFLHHDVSSVPTEPLSPQLSDEFDPGIARRPEAP
ncbi:glycosyl transferase family 2 [Paracidovorax avenae]|uniref:glycosyltransferase family 2 protein n=1 Tax=Paracidovorax avenae TaxID=80867 RepID=UPI000D218AB1|nr:glycosyltransferase family 2 protein [Paracidovorax avenae]AVS93571.1 glycosyl transferase family 2 [Paracidovorax avenae]AVT00208.1 glycosyl transferase family 2 [Paracidovorax avenae]AVT07165.1 glycosyl transferase family 2 [Paracidovorax avenae]